MQTILAGSCLSRKAVSTGSKRSWTVSAEAKYDGESRQEAITGGLVYDLWVSSEYSYQNVFTEVYMLGHRIVTSSYRLW